MRIVIAAGIFPPDIGGPATYAKVIAEALSNAGHTVVVVTFGEPGREELQLPYRLFRVSRGGSAAARYLRYFFTLMGAVRSGDLIFAQGPVAGGLSAFAVSKLLGVPYVVKVTGDYAWEQGVARYGMRIGIDEFQSLLSMPAAVRRLRRLQGIVVRAAAQVIVPSEYLKRMVIGWGVSSSRLSVIYNAVTPQAVTADPRKTKDGLGVTGKLVVSAGRFVPWKGFRGLIMAWPGVLKKVPDAHLVIVGDGPQRKELGELILANALSERVVLAGSKEPLELARILSAADAFVLNSGYEGFSHMIVEALSYGVPCAVSGAGGNPEIIRDGESGIVFRYDDESAISASVVRLLTDAAAARGYVRSAGSLLSRLTTASMVAQTQALLEKISRGGVSQ